jgi:histidyl-tRNA synthetase
MAAEKIKEFPPAGTRDFYPEDMPFRNWLFNHWKKISLEFGFFEYDAPVVEHADLWTKKSGGSDILNEMYVFEKDGIQLALRPEMTPSLARMMINYLPTAIMPVKLFSIPQCWRYENVAKGRRREFYQWNVDIFGAEKVKSEIEVFMMLVEFFRRIGLTENDIIIRISNRMIIQKVLDKMGIKDNDFLKVCHIIDKMGKLVKEDISKMLQEIGLDDNMIKVIYDLTLVKTVGELEEFLGKDDETFLEMNKLFEYAEKVGISKYIELDLKIIRGLNYYTGVVFEAFVKDLGIGRSILGGGVYNNLMESFGYMEKVNSIGFGMGDIIIFDILKQHNRLPLLILGVEYVVVPFNDNYFCDACYVANKLREKGKIVDVYSKPGKIKGAYSYADRKNANKVIFIAPTEWSNKQIVIKDLRENDQNKKQVTVDLDQYLKSL